jgi:integrase
MGRKRTKRASGRGSVIPSTSGNFRVRWRENGRRRIASGFTSREQAEKVLAKILADLADGRGGLPRDPKSVPTLGELAVDWLQRRAATHRAIRADRGRWENHLRDHVGHYRPSEVTPAVIRSFVEAKLAEGLNPATVGHCFRLLSTFYTDLVERGMATVNPARSVPRSTRRLFKPTVDPHETPFLQRLEDVRRVYLALAEPYSVAFALGCFAGLRTGEVLGMDWRNIDLAGRRIHVRVQMREGRLAPLKDTDSRIVPLLNPLAPILAMWRLKTGGEGLMFRPRYPARGGRPGSPSQFIRLHTLHAALRGALERCELPAVSWYQATRHTFASLWCMGGGSIEKLSAVMGHSSTLVTQRYAHLRPELFTARDFGHMDVDLAAGDRVVSLAVSGEDRGAAGHSLGTATVQGKTA